MSPFQVVKSGQPSCRSRCPSSPRQHEVGRRGTPMDDALRPVDLDRRPVGLHRADLTAGGQRIPAEVSAAAKYELVEVIQKNAPPCCGTPACADRRSKRSMPRTLECGWAGRE